MAEIKRRRVVNDRGPQPSSTRSTPSFLDRTSRESFLQTAARMIFSAIRAPVTFLAIFGNAKRFFDEFNLLMNFRRFIGGCQNTTARGTFVQGRLFDLIHLLRLKSDPKIAFISLLRALFAFLSLIRRFGAARQYPTTAASKNSTSSS